MRKHPYEDKDGFRCWLSRNEQKRLIQHFDDDPRKQLGIELALSGLRGDEVVKVTREDVRSLDVDTDAYVLIVPDGKTGYRETPLKPDVQNTLKIFSNAAQKTKDEALLGVTTRTLRRWVTAATDDLASTTGNDDWEFVGPHDLRRTWATDTYWSIGASAATETVVMMWGGWRLTESGRETFRKHYLGAMPDHVAAELMEDAGFL